MGNKEEHFVFDLNNIIKFCSGGKPFKRDDIEITDIFTTDEDIKDLASTQKQIREIKSNDANAEQSMRYELVKMLMVDVMQSPIDDIEEINKSITFNTMLNNGFIKMIQ